MSRVSWSLCRWLPIKRTGNRSLIARRGWRRLRKCRERPAYYLCQYLNCSKHLIRRPRIVRNENLDDRSGEACPAWVARHEIADGAGEDAKADDRAGLKRPPEYYLLKHISVTQSIHLINFKPGGNDVIGCAGRVGRAGQGNDNSARLHRCRKTGKPIPPSTPPRIAVPCAYCALVSVAPYLKTLAVSCQPTLWFGIVPLTQASGSAITLPPVTAPADMLALNHSLMRLSFVVAPVLPRAVMQSPRPGTSKLHAGRVQVGSTSSVGSASLQASELPIRRCRLPSLRIVPSPLPNMSAYQTA
jgi:hypothetical protein